MPVSLLGHCNDAEQLHLARLSIPFYSDPVCAGFGNTAQDHIEKHLDLNEMCITNPVATFFVRVEGESMIELGIFHRDILVVDRSITAEHGDIVVAAIHGELTVKELETKPIVRLVPHNKLFPAIDIPEDSDLVILGVVTNVVRKLGLPRRAQL